MSLFKYIVENKLEELPNVDKEKFHDIFDKRIILMEYIIKLIFNFDFSINQLEKNDIEFHKRIILMEHIVNSIFDFSIDQLEKYDIEFHKKINIKLADYIIEKLTNCDIISKLNIKTYKEMIDFVISSEHSKEFTPLYPNLNKAFVNQDSLYRLDYNPNIELTDKLKEHIVDPFFNSDIEKSINKDNIVEIFTKLDDLNYNILQFSTNNEYQDEIATLYTEIYSCFRKKYHIDNQKEYVKENKEFLESLLKARVNSSCLINKIISLCNYYKIDYRSLNVLNQLGELKPLQNLYIDKIENSSIKKIYNIVTIRKIKSELIDDTIDILDSCYVSGAINDDNALKCINSESLIGKSLNMKNLEYFCKWMLDNENIAKTHLPNHYNKLPEYMFEKIITIDDKIELIKTWYKNKKEKEEVIKPQRKSNAKVTSQTHKKMEISSSSSDSDSYSDSESDD